MQIAIEKAKTAGTGWVATRNSNHFGIAGYYAMMALREKMIGICLTNANPLVAPTFSISRMMGTNPIAVAIPAREQPPLVADFATTRLARVNIAVSEMNGEKVAFGFLSTITGSEMILFLSREDRCTAGDNCMAAIKDTVFRLLSTFSAF